MEQCVAYRRLMCGAVTLHFNGDETSRGASQAIAKDSRLSSIAFVHHEDARTAVQADVLNEFIDVGARLARIGDVWREAAFTERLKD